MLVFKEKPTKPTSPMAKAIGSRANASSSMAAKAISASFMAVPRAPWRRTTS